MFFLVQAMRLFLQKILWNQVLLMWFVKHVEVAEASGIACAVHCAKSLASHRTFSLAGAWQLIFSCIFCSYFHQCLPLIVIFFKHNHMTSFIKHQCLYEKQQRGERQSYELDDDLHMLLMKQLSNRDSFQSYSLNGMLVLLISSTTGRRNNAALHN